MDGRIMSGPLLDKMRSRVATDSQEGDIAYFNTLALQLEYVTKLVTAAVLASIADDATDRHRYSLEHTLVRADSIGDWIESLNTALTGPAAQCFMPRALPLIRQLNERVGEGDWRYDAVRSLQRLGEHIGVDTQVGQKAPLRQLFQIGAQIRNRTRGHGATTAEQCGHACPILSKVIDDLTMHLEFFKLSWAYLHRNLSGKFRVSPLLGGCNEFDYLKRTRDVSLPNGVFVYLDQPVLVPLVFSDPDASDVLVPNGNFKGGTCEALSYVTNDVVRKSCAAWLDPPGRLPPSGTEGRQALEPVGNAFANLPPAAIGYVPRTDLEKRLREELTHADRHPIVSL